MAPRRHHRRWSPWSRWHDSLSRRRHAKPSHRPWRIRHLGFTQRGADWLPPVPLGAGINSDGYDVFPFFSPDGKDLYFVRDFATLLASRSPTRWPRSRVQPNCDTWPIRECSSPTPTATLSPRRSSLVRSSPCIFHRTISLAWSGTMGRWTRARVAGDADGDARHRIAESVHYCQRSVSIGSMRVPRSVGPTAPSKPTATSRAIVTAYTHGATG